MWRVIAMLAVLSGCATAPAPEPRQCGGVFPLPTDEKLQSEEAADADASERRNEPDCGGTGPVLPAADDVVATIEEKVHEKCAARAAAGHRQGEVRVVLHPDRKREPEPGSIHPWRPKLETELHLDMTDEDRRCVENAARAVFGAFEQDAGLPIDEVWRGMRKDVTFYVALGEPKPLFPPKPDVIARWQAAAGSGAARERFRAQMPADVTLTDDDCLSIPNRPAFNDRAESWLATVISRVRVAHHKEVGDRSRQEICLLRGPE